MRGPGAPLDGEGQLGLQLWSWRQRSELGLRRVELWDSSKRRGRGRGRRPATERWCELQYC